jgi:two-component system, OmpR family, alkaline phosphatase synthesis response regulator PhoP
MPTVLLVDDDAAIRDVLGAYLEHAGYGVLEAADGVRALEQAGKADVVVLDIMLPEIDGYEVAKVLKRDYPELPILMLTAKAAEDERVLGLELGADDYVVKPFSPREVVARIKALLRRTGLKDTLQHGELAIETKTHQVFVGTKEIELTKLEFELLLTLAQHPGYVWSRNRLLEKVWGTDFTGLERVVDARIKALRKKLGDDVDEPRFIETVHGLGYRMKEERGKVKEER